MLSWKEFDQLIRGSKVWIFAPGPSLKVFDWSVVPDDVVKVCVNDAVFLCPDADVLMTMDSNLHKEYKDKYEDILTDTGSPFVKQATFSGEHALACVGFSNPKGIVKLVGFDLMFTGDSGHALPTPWRNSPPEDTRPSTRTHVLRKTFDAIEKYNLKIQAYRG